MYLMEEAQLRLKPLYKKTNADNIQVWCVGVKDNVVYTQWGILGSDKLQETSEVVKGKNIGKANETTPEEQARRKLFQLWEKKQKEGYVDNLDQARRGENDLPSFDPMLAKEYQKCITKIKSPEVYVQPKLDGMRCIAILESDLKFRLYTRSRKLITTVPHINQQLEQMFKPTLYPLVPAWFSLDGELYTHEFKDDFNEIMSLLKRDEVHPESFKIQYHIYDLPFADKNGFDWRWDYLLKCFKDYTPPHLKIVDTKLVANDPDLLKKELEHYVSLGYEGLMVRDPKGLYEKDKRSNALLKYKEFQDAEFIIFDVKEGSGKLSGHAGSFTCLLPDGSTFDVKLKGPLADLRGYLVNKHKYIGKPLMVKFFNYTPDGKPRFPVGLRIRESVDY